MAGEKRTQDNEDSIIKENVVIVDIEGTTTSISFVKDKLFPYVRENVKKYIDTKWEDEEFKKDLEILKEQAKKDEEDKTEGVVPISGSTVDEEKESLVKNVIWQMDGDRKTTGLKQLQGHMWREAYDSGKIKGHVYEDVPECLKSWKKSGKKIYVYSSGSVEAQKLLFGHSEHGDLLEYFSGHFDTAVGMKQEAASYKNILNQIKVEASDVIFLTDIVKEAKAAKEAGISSIIMIREGNAPLTAEEIVEFRTAKSFLDLPFLNPAKRQKLETPEESEKPESVPEKMEVSDDAEMTDLSHKDSKSKDEAKPEAEGSEEKTTALETVAEKDEAMETDGKTVETVKEIRETKTVEETVKIIERETEKVEKSKAADETDKAIVVDAKETEITEKSVKVSEKKAETEVAMEEKAETVPEIKTETKTEGTDKESEPSKNDKIENQTENGKSDSAETEEVEKNEPKVAESVAEDSEKMKPKSDQAETESKENGTSKTDEMISKTDNEVKEKTEDSKITEEAEKEEEAKKEIVATEAKKEEETKEADVENKEEGKTEISKDTVAEPVKKLNGTTQNGDSGKTADDDTKKIHTNGVNEPCTSESSNTNTIKEVSQQNREAESSDSIKVKKVVDSTVADGAGEQDVVTPAVPVAATS